MHSGITRGRVLNGELMYKVFKLIYLHLFQLQVEADMRCITASPTKKYLCSVINVPPVPSPEPGGFVGVGHASNKDLKKNSCV